MTEADLLQTLKSLSGRDWSREIAQWVHGTDDLPLAELLLAHGVTLQEEAPQWAQRLGLRVSEPQGLQVKVVLRGGLAEQAGFMAGDEWLAVETEGGTWRMTKMDDLPLYAGPAAEVTAWISRDRRVFRLPLRLQPAPGRLGDTVRLTVSDPAQAERWLATR